VDPEPFWSNSFLGFFFFEWSCLWSSSSDSLVFPKHPLRARPPHLFDCAFFSPGLVDSQPFFWLGTVSFILVPPFFLFCRAFFFKSCKGFLVVLFSDLECDLIFPWQESSKLISSFLLYCLAPLLSRGSSSPAFLIS